MIFCKQLGGSGVRTVATKKDTGDTVQLKARPTWAEAGI